MIFLKKQQIKINILPTMKVDFGKQIKKKILILYSSISKQLPIEPIISIESKDLEKDWKAKSKLKTYKWIKETSLLFKFEIKPKNGFYKLKKKRNVKDVMISLN